MAKTYSNFEAFEHKGVFHLPGFDELVSGIVSYSPEQGIRLDLIGSLKSSIQELFFNQKVDCINGEIETGKDVTLFNCFSSFTGNSTCSFVVERYKCSYMLIGLSVSSHSECKYKQAICSFPVLPFWCQPQKLNTHRRDSHILSCSIELDNLFSDIIGIKISNDKTLTLCENCGFKADLSTKSLTFNENTIARFDYESPRSLENITYDTQIFADFLSFMTLDLQECSSIRIELEENKSAWLIHKPTIELNMKKNVMGEFLAKYEQIKEYLPELISTWYDNKKSRPIVAHLIDSITYRKVFTENDFLMVIQALDGYSKRYYSNKNKGLSERIQEIYDKYKSLYIFCNESFDAHSIAHTRNYYSHLYDESTLQGDELIDPIALYNTTGVIRKLLICCVMELVGFSVSQIENITQNSTNYYLQHSWNKN